MAAPYPGRYIIRPKEPSGQALLIGRVPTSNPPPDVSVEVASGPISPFLLIPAAENTFTVFMGKGEQEEYKFIVKGDALFVSFVSPPDRFRFESAGDDFYVIGIPNKDLLLTLDKSASPQLTFKPANGSDAQRFRLEPLFRD